MSISAFLEEVRDAIRLRHYSLRTEEAYLHRIQQFIHFHGKRHPAGLGAAEVRSYLTHLATEDQVAASTQNVARSAVLFLYRDVLGTPLPPLEGIAPAKRPERLPVVFTRAEVHALLAHLDGTPHLMASLLYGGGLRLMECLRLFTPLLSVANRGASKTLIWRWARSPSATAKARKTA
jgi:site-specific recombinase XerD